MKIIDSHVHIDLDPKEAEENLKQFGTNSKFEGLFKEIKDNKIERVVLIAEDEDENKQFIEKKVNQEQILLVMYVDPSKTSSQEYLSYVENNLKGGNFKAMKLYPGYEYFNPSEEKCKPIFQIAEKFNVPVIIHTGDTYADPDSGIKPKVRYARPHYVDDAAVDFPNVKIVIAHAGNPWFHDAAEVAYKNPNVFLDVSGWFLGTIDKRAAEVMKSNLKFIVSFVGVDKILYGSDWPIVKMKDYLNFVTKNIKLKNGELEKVMYRNALKVFWNK